MLSFGELGKAAARYVFGTFALVALMSLLYDSIALTLSGIAVLLIVTVLVLVRPSIRFPPNMAVITVSAAVLGSINNKDIAYHFYKSASWSTIGIILFLGALILYLYLDVHLRAARRKG